MLEQIASYGLAVAALSVTLARSEAGAPFRTAMAGISDVTGRMAGCYYCMAHWLALPFALLGASFTSLIPVWFGSVAVAAIGGAAIICLTRLIDVLGALLNGVDDEQQ